APHAGPHLRRLGARGEPGNGVDGVVGNTHLEVEVVAEGQSRRPDGTDRLTLVDALAEGDVDPREVGVESGDAAAVVDHDDVAVALVAGGGHAREHHDAGR